MGKPATGGATKYNLKGTKADDSFSVPNGALITQVVVDGSAGSDTLNLSGYGSGVTVNLNARTVASNSLVAAKEFTGLAPNYLITDDTQVMGTIKNVENLIGTDHNDYLGAAIPTTAKVIDGRGGNDFVVCEGGNALLIGGTGSDYVEGNGTNVRLVGGTYANGVATGDSEADTFLCTSAVTILDFEAGVDHLLFLTLDQSIANFLAGSWVSNGAGGSTLMVNGTAEVTLANIAPVLAETIELGFTAFSSGGRVEGSSGDDFLYAFQDPQVRFVFGDDSGNDVAIGFDILNDVLVFEDDIVPTWSDTTVNGAQALLGSWADGSVTIQGLDTGDVPNLHIEGLSSAPVYGSPGPGPWTGSGEVEAAAVALLAG